MQAEPSATADDAPTPTRRQPHWIGLVVLVAVPFAVASIAAFTRPWAPSGDEAIFLNGALDAPSDLPLVGVYSRYGWFHPGPLLTWWFTLPSWISGGAPAAALVATVVLKALSAGAAVLTAGRQAGATGAALAVTVAGIVLLAHPGGPWAIWNPMVVLLTVIAFLLSCWGLANGDLWSAPVLVVTGSLCTQAHLGYGPIVAAGAGWAVAAAVARWRWRAHRGDPAWDGPVRWPLITTAVLTVVAWAPVAWDQFAGEGNLGKIIDHFRTSDEPSLGIAAASRVAARSYLPWGPWAGGAEPVGLLGEAVGVSPWWLVVPSTGLALAGWSAWRRRDGVLGTLVLTAAIAAVAGLAAFGATTGTAFPYLFTWSRGVAAVVWFSVALAVQRELVAARPERDLAVRRTVVGIAVVMTAFAAIVAPTSDRPLTGQSLAVRALLPAAEAAAPAGSTVAMIIDEAFPGVGEGLVFELERAGRDVTVPPGSVTSTARAPMAAVLGNRDRSADPDTADVWLAVAVGDGRQQWDDDPAWTRIGAYDSLTPEERAEYDELRTTLQARLEEAGRAPDIVDLVRERPELFAEDPIIGGPELDRAIELYRRGLAFSLYRHR